RRGLRVSLTIMATRTPGGTKSTSRARTGSTARKRPAATKTGTKTGTRAAAKGRSARPPQQPDPLAMVIFGVGRLVLQAGLLGGLGRMYGRGARSLDPEHRRDGIGLATLGLAIILAAATWWVPDTLAIRNLGRVLRDGFGVLAGLLPAITALLAWRLLRH